MEPRWKMPRQKKALGSCPGTAAAASAPGPRSPPAAPHRPATHQGRRRQLWARPSRPPPPPRGRFPAESAGKWPFWGPPPAESELPDGRAAGLGGARAAQGGASDPWVGPSRCRPPAAAGGSSNRPIGHLGTAARFDVAAHRLTRRERHRATRPRAAGPARRGAPPGGPAGSGGRRGSPGAAAAAAQAGSVPVRPSAPVLQPEFGRKAPRAAGQGRAGPGPAATLGRPAGRPAGRTGPPHPLQPPRAGAGLARPARARAVACGGGDGPAGETAASAGWRATRSDTRPVRVGPPPEPGHAASVRPRGSGGLGQGRAGGCGGRSRACWGRPHNSVNLQLRIGPHHPDFTAERRAPKSSRRTNPRRPPTPLARPAPGVRRHRPEALGTRGGPSCRRAGPKGENRGRFWH